MEGKEREAGKKAGERGQAEGGKWGREKETGVGILTVL